jgi:hypothetical protein
MIRISDLLRRGRPELRAAVARTEAMRRHPSGRPSSGRSRGAVVVFVGVDGAVTEHAMALADRRGASMHFVTAAGRSRPTDPLRHLARRYGRVTLVVDGDSRKLERAARRAGAEILIVMNGRRTPVLRQTA